MRKCILNIILMALLTLPASASAQVLIIANKSVNAKSIDKNTLVNLYTLQSNELGSQKIKLFFLTTENETNKIFLSALSKTMPELKKIWLRAKLTGNGFAPDFVSTDEEMLEKISKTPGSIGFIIQKEVSDQVKVLTKL